MGANAFAATPIEDLSNGTADDVLKARFDAHLGSKSLAPSGWYTPGGDELSVGDADFQRTQPGGLTGNGFTRTPTSTSPGQLTPTQSKTVRTRLGKARTAAGRFPGGGSFFPAGAIGKLSVIATVVGAPLIWNEYYYLGGLLAERIGLGMTPEGIPAAAFPTNVLWQTYGFQGGARADGGPTLSEPANSGTDNTTVFIEWRLSGDSFDSMIFTDFSRCVTTSVNGNGNWNSSTANCTFVSQAYLNAEYAAYSLAIGLANEGKGHVVVGRIAGTGSNAVKPGLVWYATPAEFLEISEITEQEGATSAVTGDRTINYVPTTIDNTTRIAGATNINNGDQTTKTWINNQLDPENEPVVNPPPTVTFSPFIIPQPGIYETYQNYIERLRERGWVGTATVTAESPAIADHANGYQYRPLTVTRVTVGTGTAVDPAVWPATAPKISTTTTTVVVRYQPPAAGGGGGFVCECPPVDFSPLFVGATDKFPFGILTFVHGFFAQFGTSEAISWTLPEPVGMVTLPDNDDIRDITDPLTKLIVVLASLYFLAAWFFGWGRGERLNDD